MYDYETLFSMSSLDFCTWCNKEFSIDIPLNDDENYMQDVANVMSKISGYIGYLSELLSIIKIVTRDSKRNNSVYSYEDMMDKKDVVSLKYDTLKKQFDILSRIITIRMNDNREIFEGITDNRLTAKNQSTTRSKWQINRVG